MMPHREQELSESDAARMEEEGNVQKNAQQKGAQEKVGVAEPAPDVLEYRVELTQALNVTDFTDKILQVLNSWGFSDYSLYRLPAGIPIYTSMMTTMPDLQEVYDEGRHIKYDLTLMHAQSKSVPTYLSIIDDFISTAPFDNELFIRNRELVRLYRCFGYSDLYCIPVKAYDGNGRMALMVLSEGKEREEFRQIVEAKKSELRSLATAIDYIGSNKFPDSFCARDDEAFTISQRPLELLNTLAKENVSLKHAAKRMFISLDTANKHIASVKRALGANTQASAVYLAIKKGLIHFQD